jgi:cytochrome bd-type quinol oxidase subunit 1
MDLAHMPEPVRDIMRAAYGDATAEVFLISAAVTVVALVSVLFIKEKPLRRTVDIQPVQPAAQAAQAKEGPTPVPASAAR